MLLKNNTGSVSKIGYLVKADDKDRTAFVYADANSTNILGVITQTVPKYGLCEIVNSGTAKVYVSERVSQGSVIRAQKSGDRISRGTCSGIKKTDVSYFKIGTALESGKGLIDVVLNMSMVATASSAIVEYADNAAALAGKLTVGDFYRTGDDLKIVH